MRRLIFVPLALALSAVVILMAQTPDILTSITGTGGKPALAVPDFRGDATAQPLMAAFNKTLYDDLTDSALFDMKSKSYYPALTPQQPADFGKPGIALTDWAGAPVNASHLVFGYAAVRNGVFVVYGYVDDTRKPVPSAQVMAEQYPDSVDQPGAIRAAHKFAQDIIQRFGGTGSLLGSRIYFVSDRGPSTKFGSEIWAIDWDGNNEKQLTHLNAQIAFPAITFDGARLAFTAWLGGAQPLIMMANAQTGHPVPFYNQKASLNANASFSPDGKTIYYASTAADQIEQIYSARIDGTDLQRVSNRRAIDAEPKVNPRNPGQLLFVGGPGAQQIYRMNSDGTAVQRVTNGEGEAANPSWSPDGKFMAFAWTRSIAAGNFNIAVMDIASGATNTLTHEGRNENPCWAPDGKHIVFASTRSGKSQIFTMLADGTQVKQLTRQGVNKTPVWGVK